MKNTVDISSIFNNIIIFLSYSLILYLIITMIYNIIKPFYFSSFGSKFNIGRSDYVGFDINIRTDEAKNDPDFAPLKVFDIIGYAKTATSPIEAKPLLFLDDNHEVIINRNNLLPMARAYIEQNKNFKPPVKCKFKLSGDQVRKKMQKVLDELYNSKKILDHGMIVGKELANVLSGGDTNLSKEISEEQMYKLELESFMKLLETDKTQKRIVHTLKTSKPLIN